MTRSWSYGARSRITWVGSFLVGLVFGLAAAGNASEPSVSEELRATKVTVLDDRGRDSIVIGPTGIFGPEAYGIKVASPEGDEFWHIGYVEGKPEIALYSEKAKGSYRAVLRFGRLDDGIGLIGESYGGGRAVFMVSDTAGPLLEFRNGQGAIAELAVLRGAAERTGLHVKLGNEEKFFGLTSEVTGDDNAKAE